jgi:hypothetical protein
LATFFFCTDKETGRAGWHRAGQHLIYFASGKLKLKESKRGGGWTYRQAAGRFGAGCASEMAITDRDSNPPCFFFERLDYSLLHAPPAECGAFLWVWELEWSINSIAFDLE